MSLTINSSRWRASIPVYKSRMAHELLKVLKSEGRLLVRDLIKLTPPRGQTNNINLSYKAQRDIGNAAVKRDIKRVLRPLDELDFFKNPKMRSALSVAAGLQGGTIQKGKRKGKTSRKRVNFEETKRLLFRFGWKRPVLNKADPDIHRRARGARGRTPKRSAMVAVVRPLTVKNYVTQAQKQVGRAKKGWMAAARALGTKSIPNWVRNNPGTASGGFRMERTNPLRPSLTVINRVAYAGDFRAMGITDFAVNLRRKNMRLKAARALRALNHRQH